MAKYNTNTEDLIDEIWKDIPNYEGMYMASNKGRIKSLKRVEQKVNGILYTIPENMLGGGIYSDGYRYVGLSKLNTIKRYSVHQLIAITFLGHIVDGFNNVVNHIDMDKMNNNVENLEIVSNRKNISLSKKEHKKRKLNGYTISYGKYKSSIQIKKTSIFLGNFDTEKEASDVYELAVLLINSFDGSQSFFRNYVMLIHNANKYIN